MSMRVTFLDTIIQLAKSELDQIDQTWEGQEMPLYVKARIREVNARLEKYEKQREFWKGKADE